MTLGRGAKSAVIRDFVLSRCPTRRKQEKGSFTTFCGSDTTLTKETYLACVGAYSWFHNVSPTRVDHRKLSEIPVYVHLSGASGRSDVLAKPSVIVFLGGACHLVKTCLSIRKEV